MDFQTFLNKTSTSQTNIIPCVIYNKQQAPTEHGSDSKGNAILNVFQSAHLIAMLS